MDYPGRVSIDTNNNSDEDVWFSHFCPNQIDASFDWDNYCGETRVYYKKTALFLVKSHVSSFIFDSPTKHGWEWIKKKEYPDSLRIQVWKDELIQNVGWEDFLQNFGEKYTYELEYVIDLDYFIENNQERYTIGYPPSGSEDFMRIVYPQPLE